MRRRLVFSHLKSLAALSSPSLSASKLTKFTAANPTFASCSSFLHARHFSSEKNIEDVMPIATGTEREELLAELEGGRYLDINYPEGPFGTKEAPAVVKSIFYKRVVGCPREDEHDVVGFGWRKASLMNVQSVHGFLNLKWWNPVEILLNTGMRRIINVDCSQLFSLWNKSCKKMKRHCLANGEAFRNTEAFLFLQLSEIESFCDHLDTELMTFVRILNNK